MFRTLAERLVRTNASQWKSGWKRGRGDFLVKTRRLTDGELLHLMLGRSPENESPEDERFYKSLQEIRAQTLKSGMWLIGSGAFGILTHFHVLKSAASNGLEVSPSIFSHAALLVVSASFCWFSFSFCKQSYIQSWFLAKTRSASSQVKAILLFKYPEAYFHINYLPGAIGTPPHILGQTRMFLQILALMLFLAALALFAIGSWLLWVTVAQDVWHSQEINGFGGVITLILSTVLVLLGLTSPLRYDSPRRYRHYGLVSSLNKLEGQALVRSQTRVINAARNLDLLGTPSSHSAGR